MGVYAGWSVRANVTSQALEAIEDVTRPSRDLSPPPIPVTPSAMPSSTPESVLVVQNSEPMTMNNGYKGKAARSWHHLPGEIVRYASVVSPCLALVPPLFAPPPRSTSFPQADRHVLPPRHLFGHISPQDIGDQRDVASTLCMCHLFVTHMRSNASCLSLCTEAPL